MQSKLKALEDKPVMKDLRETYEHMRGLEGEIYLQARNIGGYFWTAEERTHFDNPAQQEVHEKNWESLPGVVRSALRNYDTKRGVKFSTYLASSIKLKTSQNYDKLNSGEETSRQQRLRTTHLSEFPESVVAERPATVPGPEKSPLEAELTREIAARLASLGRTDPLNMRLYLERHMDGKKLRELGVEQDVTKERIRQRAGKAGTKIQELLGPLYEDYVVNAGLANHEDNERMFARASCIVRWCRSKRKCLSTHRTLLM